MALIRIATRKSPLALWQAEHVAACLRQHHIGVEIELIKISTKGDKILDAPLSKIGGKALFVKELEQSIAAGKADIAVHSMKDVPMELPPGFQLPVIMQREEPADAFVSNQYSQLSMLPDGAIVGTSSLRRQAQIAVRFPNLQIKSLRGNVGTRLQKLDDGEYDAIILAAAGLMRLGLENRITGVMQTQESLPAVGQGAIGIECRENDETIAALIQPLHDADTNDCVRAERAMNNRLNGGCQVPIAGFAVLEGAEIYLRGLVAEPDGSKIIQGEIRGNRHDAESLGRNLAEDLLNRGAGSILSALGINA